MAQETDITLYTAGTPNGQKISTTLEELGLQYQVHHIDISKNEQKQEWYLKINPNGRIPAIVDRTGRPEGQGKRVFEGQAIQLYLTEKYDKENMISFEYDSDEYWECVEWMTWMQSGIGPMQGQANHFYRYAPTKIEYAVDRYQTETKRLYQVLNDRVAGQPSGYIVGGRFSIADLSCFSWVNWAEWAGVETAPFPALQAWLERVQERAGVRRGVDVPEKFEMKEKMRSKEGAEEYARYHSNWVMQGMQEDREKHR